MSVEPVRVGLIGAGNISLVYLNAMARSPVVELRKIATRNPGDVAELAGQNGAQSATVEDLLADPAIELVVNLTPGVAHAALNGAAIDAGKHVYSEKPFALSRAVAEDLAARAERRNVLIGSAPDTFYGGAHQAARHALDSGAIGKPVFGMSFLGLPGLELFHPNPSAFYQPGGEPPFDAGPYYFTNWIHLLGPVRSVYAVSGAGQSERTVKRGPRAGTAFPVEVDTTYNIILEFETTSVSFVISLDVVTPTLRPGELYGSNGALLMPDPMFFGGEPTLIRSMTTRETLDLSDFAFSKPNRRDHVGHPAADYRGVGLTDVALAIRNGSQHRTAPDFIVHAVDVMESVAISARERRVVKLETTCDRPRPLDPVLDADLIALTPSPYDLPETD